MAEPGPELNQGLGPVQVRQYLTKKMDRKSLRKLRRIVVTRHIKFILILQQDNNKQMLTLTANRQARAKEKVNVGMLTWAPVGK